MTTDQQTPLRVALLGGGVVGGSVARQLITQADDLAQRIGRPLELVGVAVRRAGRDRSDLGVDPALFQRIDDHRLDGVHGRPICKQRVRLPRALGPRATLLEDRIRKGLYTCKGHAGEFAEFFYCGAGTHASL